MVILRDFPYNNALFGLVSFIMTPKNDPCSKLRVHLENEHFEPKTMKVDGSDDFSFQTGDFQVNQPLIFGVTGV